MSNLDVIVPRNSCHKTNKSTFVFWANCWWKIKYFNMLRTKLSTSQRCGIKCPLLCSPLLGHWVIQCHSKLFAKNVVTLFDSSCQYHTWLPFFRVRALGSEGQIKKGAKNLLVLQKHCAQGHVAQWCWNQSQVSIQWPGLQAFPKEFLNLIVQSGFQFWEGLWDFDMDITACLNRILPVSSSYFHSIFVKTSRVFFMQEQWLKSCLSWLVHVPVYMWLQLLLQCVVQVMASFGLHVNVCMSYMNKSCKGWYCRGQLGLGIIHVEQLPAAPLAPLANTVRSLTYNGLYVRLWRWNAIPSFSPATILMFSKR
jgi:hypothetical protein